MATLGGVARVNGVWAPSYWGENKKTATHVYKAIYRGPHKSIYNGPSSYLEDHPLTNWDGPPSRGPS